MKDKGNAVILFVFNRPDHTKKTLQGLKENSVSKLHVFCDGARNLDEKKKVKEVRKLIDEIEWCEVEKHFSEINLGLASSVINGISKIFSEGYNSVTVLEDDCTPKKGFIDYMNKLLEHYQHNEKVMHVSGFGLPIKKYTNRDVFLTPYPCSWGWGTWKEVWEGCNFELLDEYKSVLENTELKNKFNYAGEGFSKFLSLQLEGKVNSWLIRWYYYIFSQNGLCVWSYDSLIANNGFDGSGIHKVKRDRFNQKAEAEFTGKDIKFEDNFDLNKNLIREFRRFFIGSSLIEKVRTYIYLKTGFLIEKKIR
ncbi:sugar transferase [Priestia megaterium]|uniref:sugar transferase n=1 Tax=Priestia megaterium TaxID=1404 RepID=UPI0015D4AF25|nr:sugar transferase [Priestia megaterium]